MLYSRPRCLNDNKITPEDSCTGVCSAWQSTASIYDDTTSSDALKWWWDRGWQRAKEEVGEGTRWSTQRNSKSNCCILNIILLRGRYYLLKKSFGYIIYIITPPLHDACEQYKSLLFNFSIADSVSIILYAITLRTINQYMQTLTWKGFLLGNLIILQSVLQSL